MTIVKLDGVKESLTDNDLPVISADLQQYATVIYLCYHCSSIVLGGINILLLVYGITNSKWYLVFHF